MKGVGVSSRQATAPSKMANKTRDTWIDSTQLKRLLFTLRVGKYHRPRAAKAALLDWRIADPVMETQPCPLRSYRLFVSSYAPLPPPLPNTVQMPIRYVGNLSGARTAARRGQSGLSRSVILHILCAHHNKRERGDADGGSPESGTAVATRAAKRFASSRGGISVVSLVPAA